MKLFSELRGQLGQNGVRTFRHVEGLAKKLAASQNHLRFNLRCKDENIIPTSLRIRSPINTPNAHKIVDRCRKQLLRERINITTKKIKTTKQNYECKRESFLSDTNLHGDIQTAVSAYLARSRENTFMSTKRRHLGKLEKLIARKNANESADKTVDLSGSQLSRWVINHSSRQLSDTETKVLARGLNFAISPKKIPHEDFIVATESACAALPPSDKAGLRNEVAGILRNAKAPKPNISREETKALTTLAKDDTILILPADKGRSTVILDKDKYIDQVKTMLSDKNTYEVLETDPTEKNKRKLVKLLSELKKSNKITEPEYTHLYPTAEGIPRLYCTPKIHKPEVPVRLIVDCTGAVTYNTPTFLVNILRPLVGKTPQHCKNSKELAKELISVKVEQDEQLISHDVVALFTKTPVDPTLDIVRRRLEHDKTLRRRTKLKVEDIMKILSFVTKSTYFMFQGVIYKQVEGFAMGDPLSAVMSNIFMEDLESQAIPSAPTECALSLWKCYVDDIPEKIKTGTIKPLTDHLN